MTNVLVGVGVQQARHNERRNLEEDQDERSDTDVQQLRVGQIVHRGIAALDSGQRAAGSRHVRQGAVAAAVQRILDEGQDTNIGAVQRSFPGQKKDIIHLRAQRKSSDCNCQLDDGDKQHNREVLSENRKLIPAQLTQYIQSSAVHCCAGHHQSDRKAKWQA